MFAVLELREYAREVYLAPMLWAVFRKRLRALCDQRNWNQPDLARESGLNQTQVSKYLAGKSSPTIQSAMRIALALDCPIDALLEGVDRDYDRLLVATRKRAVGEMPDLTDKERDVLRMLRGYTPYQIEELTATMRGILNLNRRRNTNDPKRHGA